MAQLSNLMLITDILVQINARVGAIAIPVFQIFCIADVVDRCQMGGWWNLSILEKDNEIFCNAPCVDSC